MRAAHRQARLDFVSNCRILMPRARQPVVLRNDVTLCLEQSQCGESRSVLPRELCESFAEELFEALAVGG